MAFQPNSIRIWRSINTRFGVAKPYPDDLNDETVTANAVYTDEELKKIADSGFNGIWVHGLLREIVPSKIFPEFGRNAKIHLKNMRELVKKAGKYGIKVYFYMQPPRAINVKWDFWKHHPEVGGSNTTMYLDDCSIETVRSLCTSTQPVRDYLVDSSANLIKSLPGLGGVIMITASEYPAHCWGRGGLMFDEIGETHLQEIDCPRCKQRNPIEVVNEVITLVRDGIRKVSSAPHVIAWNWSWTAYEKDPSPTIIKNIPKDVIYMAGFERGGNKTILGKKRSMDEYSITFAGPSARFRNSMKVARKSGLRVMTKLQFGTTHELATVPNLPIIGNLYEKARFLKVNKLAGFMGTWNFGNMITANTAAFNYFLTKRSLKGKREELVGFATKYFPGCDAKGVTEAWLQFADAGDNYPFSIPMLYAGPINYTLAFPLHPKQVGKRPAGFAWLPVSRRGDNLETSFGGYTIDEIIRGFGLINKKWKPAVELFEKSLAGASGEHKTEELNTAWTCYHVFRSVWNTYRAYKLRRKWTDQHLPAYRKIISNELANLEQVLPIIERDSRLGFHGEGFLYMFNSKLVKKKIALLKKQLREI